MWVYGSGMPKGLNVGKALLKRGEWVLAREWEGFRSDLKPAWEPIIVARKALSGSITDNVVCYGVGGINTGRCSIPSNRYDTEVYVPNRVGYKHPETYVQKESKGVVTTFHCNESRPTAFVENGRFPANLIHDGSEEVVCLFRGM
jgi:site-specific DNA-methyltransferase (adenine-specific)